MQNCNPITMSWFGCTTHYYCNCNRSEVRCKKSALKPSTQIILFRRLKVFCTPFWRSILVFKTNINLNLQIKKHYSESSNECFVENLVTPQVYENNNYPSERISTQYEVAYSNSIFVLQTNIYLNFAEYQCFAKNSETTGVWI